MRASVVLMAWVFLLKVPSSLAQTTSQGQLGPSLLEAIRKKGSLYTEMTWGAGLRDYERTDFSSAAYATVIPSYRISSGTSLTGRMTLKQGLTGSKKMVLSTAYLGSTQKITKLGKNDFIAISATGRIYFPWDKEQKEKTSFRGLFLISPTVLFDLTRIGVSFLKYTFRPSYSEALHEFKTFNGTVNNRRTLGLISTFQVPLTEKFAWNILWGLNERWNYRGTRSETYVLDSSIGLEMSKESSLSAGYSIEAATKTTTGENKIKLYDNENGSAYLTLAYQL